MLALIDWAKRQGKIKNEIDFLKQIGINERIRKVKGGLSFAASHVVKAARITGVNVKWILGLSKNMHNPNHNMPQEDSK